MLFLEDSIFSSFTSHPRWPKCSLAKLLFLALLFLAFLIAHFSTHPTLSLMLCLVNFCLVMINVFSVEESTRETIKNKLSLSLIKSCELMLSYYCFLLYFFPQTIIKSINHEYHKRKQTKNISSKTGKNPSKGKAKKESPLFL